MQADPSRPSVLAVCFFSSAGPVGDNFHTLCRALGHLTRLSVLTSPVLRDREFPGAEEVTFADFPKQQPWSWLGPGRWRSVLRLIRRRRYDLIFIYSEHPLHAAVLQLARANRSLFWCLDPAPHSGSFAPFAAMYEVAKRFLLRRADRVAVACEGLREDVVSRYRIAPGRVLTSFHGVLDNLAFPIDPATPRDIDVLFFGRLAYYKGIDVLLDAVAKLRDRGVVPAVHIAGPGKYPVPDAPNVTVDNRYVPDRELAELVARARVVVMPYRDATGSQVPQTAFSYGTPVIASHVGCIGEYVEDGTTGLLVPPADPVALADAIEKVLQHPALWETLSRSARDRARTVFDNGALTRTLLKRALS